MKGTHNDILKATIIDYIVIWTKWCEMSITCHLLKHGQHVTHNNLIKHVITSSSYLEMKLNN